MPLDALFAISKVLADWLPLIVFILLLRNPKINWNFQFIPRKRYFSGIWSSRRWEYSIDIFHQFFRPKLEKFCSKLENNLKKIIIRSENHFPQLLFCQRGLFVSQPCRNFPAQNPKKPAETNVFQKKSVRSRFWSGREKVGFDSRSGNFLVGKGEIFLPKSDKNDSLLFSK